MVLVKAEGIVRKRLLVLAVIGFVGASMAVADEDDPPSRAARLSFLAGTVSFQPGSVEDWVPAMLNRPMTTGDRLWTEAGARAEMHIGSAALRMNGRTSFSFLNLDDRTVQVQVSVGTLNVRLRNLADSEVFEIDTPHMALTLLRAGEYRVDVNEEGDASIVSVRGGDAEANAGSQAVTVRAREQLRVTGADQPVFDRRDIPPADPFDNFCENRDRREDMSASAMARARGARAGNMAWCGTRAGCSRAGLRIVTGIGRGSRRGAGPGWTMRRGAMLRSITDGGCSSRERGAGCRVRSGRVRCMLRRWWPGSAEAGLAWASEWAWGRRWAGSRWGLAKCGCRGIATVRRTFNR